VGLGEKGGGGGRPTRPTRPTTGRLHYHFRADTIPSPYAVWSHLSQTDNQLVEEMTLDIGTRLGPYEILSPLGAGGMGEVYKARDTRLNRTVAIKVLPQHISDKPELKARLEREAQTLASLSHPHICVIHDIGHQDRVDFIVMEYLEGQTLAQRVEKGALPLDEALTIAIEIADALDKAHRQGVIHRDLKPGNIMLTKSGAKLLDFGLAKLKQDAQTPAAPSELPTKAAITAQGAILGTLQYMAPEQLEGQEADARSDIFAFGAVLYEMVTARKAFEGKSHASLMASILKETPKPISALQPTTPPALDHLAKRCLAKDPEKRWQSARDLVLELEWARDEKTPAAVSTALIARGSRRMAWITAALAAGLLSALVPATKHLLEPAADVTVRRFTIEAPLLMPNQTDLAISPDGRRLAFVAPGPDTRTPMLWVRPMNSLTAQALSGTEQAGRPYWSPDSRFIVFAADERLKRIDVLGGLPQTLCAVTTPSTNLIGGFRGATWNDEGVILFSDGPRSIRSVLYRVPAAGGEPVKLTDVEPSNQESGYLWPYFLPDNKHFLFTAVSNDPSNSAIYVASMETGERVRVVDNTLSMAVYSPLGFLLYQRLGTLMAQPFDAERAAVTGEAFPIADELAHIPYSGASSFSVSRNGALAYTIGSATTVERQFAWYSRTGKALGTVGSPAGYQQARLSPDEKRVAYNRDGDLWLMELASGIASRFTYDTAVESDPVWSPDGQRVAFYSTKQGKRDIYMKTVGGSQEELLFASDENKGVDDWSGDGETLVFRMATGNNPIYALSLNGERKAKKLFEDPFAKNEVHLSPDSKWAAFNANDSGRMEVYVASFPAFTDKRQVSTAGGAQARWRGDGQELYYLSLDGKLMSVDVRTNPVLRTGVSTVLFETQIFVDPLIDQYNPTSDGQRFLLIEPRDSLQPIGARAITVVLDWAAELPAGK